MPSLAELRSFLIVHFCGSSSSLSDPSSIAKVLTTTAAISYSLRSANEALQTIASGRFRVNNDTEQQERLDNNVVYVPSLSASSSAQIDSSAFLNPVCILKYCTQL